LESSEKELATKQLFKDLDVWTDVSVKMRDGIRLAADIYQPRGNEELPILLLRTPYGRADAQSMNYRHPAWYARQGYIVVVQDCRGRGDSEGVFDPYRHEGADGKDTIDWAQNLPGSNGKVGMYGFSYCGYSQLLTAAERPDGLMCMVPAMAGSDVYDGKLYKNGAFALALNLSWLLFVGKGEAARRQEAAWHQKLTRALSNIKAEYALFPENISELELEEKFPFLQAWLENVERNGYWKAVSAKESYEQISHVPALHIGGWYDVFIDGTIENFKHLSKRAASNHYLRIAPWYHMPWSQYVGELDFGREARNHIDEMQIKWFDFWLKDDKSAWAEEPPVQYFLTGANHWQNGDRWPPEKAAILQYYLHSERGANSISGDGLLTATVQKQGDPDIYVYQPGISMPALGGKSGADPVLTPMGPKNQQPIEIRNDLLIYTSEPLDQDLKIAGEVSAVLYAATTADDTDFVIKIMDVSPDGRAYNLGEGIVRASRQQEGSKPAAVRPGSVGVYTISAGHIAHVFKQGHAVRLHVTSSLFPTYLPHSNSFNSSKARTATQLIYHDEVCPSHIKLPVIPKKVRE